MKDWFDNLPSLDASSTSHSISLKQDKKNTDFKSVDSKCTSAGSSALGEYCDVKIGMNLYHPDESNPQPYTTIVIRIHNVCFSWTKEKLA